ncbi:tetratricopeptide repeat protein [Spirosoma linguale]|uniref:Tetratricopeptide TPR_2 repeat protein n=1 Tax=Spirosoma linguale (strain ATCC 33905 / DSM 74 / LMG 10896 / Claus 1) TaxID=504472 RepID=D2QKF3_SPILD|nr:Tetratricopeptide TPR_2 repeat protein [Spirosoma linguale DSM 74]
MHKLIHPFILLLLLTVFLMPSRRVMGGSRETAKTVVVDEEYDRYRKRGDDLFKEGKYLEARRQYQNCLEVPGFENDTYAKEQIQECTTGLALRKQADDAMRQGKGAEAIKLMNQLLNLNPDDLITKGQFADYYEREGNQLFNQKQYLRAKESYSKALSYTTTRQETLRLQIRTIDNLSRPSKQVGIKVVTGLVAVGAGAYALLLRNDYNSKFSALNQISQTADPTGSGIIADPNTYRQYNEAYSAAEAAQQKNGLFKACVGVAAVATVAELYLLLHKPKPSTSAFQWKPSSQSWGLAVGYTF